MKALSLLYVASFTVLGCFGFKDSNNARAKRAQNCYPDLGCFSNDPPFTNTEGALPLDRHFIQTTFRLYTQFSARPAPSKLVLHDMRRLNASGFNPLLPTKFLIHGFLQNGRARWMVDMAMEFLRKENMNVIVVDWGRGSGFPYTQAAANTRLVGAEISALIQFLNSATGASNSQFHLIGHSLGAHVAGYAGRRLNRLGRITGLDPAQPNFAGTDVDVRLDKTDARLVDIIHTDDANFSTIAGYGMREQVGHMDFYPNGGHNQPGCSQVSWTGLVENLDRRGIEGTADSMSCSHSRSIFLFTESINSVCPFRSFPCNNSSEFYGGRCFDCGNRPCPLMGYNANRYRSNGMFFLETERHPPYCGYHYHLTVEFAASMEQEEGTLALTLLGSDGLSEIFTMRGSATNPFIPNQVREAMFLSHSDLGDIIQVQATFVQRRGYLSWIWRSRFVSLSKITVQRGKTAHSSYFCGNDVILVSNEQHGFHQTSNEADCNSEQVNVINQ